MTTLRRALGQVEPHVSLKNAWKRVIQVSRRLRKQGTPTHLHERSSVERLLAQEANPDMDLGSLKVALQRLVQAEGPEAEHEAISAVEEWAASWSPKHAMGELRIHVHHPSDHIDSAQIDRWLGTEGGHTTLDAKACAAWVHHLHGLNLGGRSLIVDVLLEGDQVLGAVERERRGRARRNPESSWLPHMDEVGRYSASPRGVAQRHGALLAEPRQPVIDPFCGAGADAIAAALAGANVLAGDHDSVRLSLAQNNAAHFGVSDRLDFRCEDAMTLLRDGLEAHPGASVFLDPPWGGVDWDRSAMNFESLFGQWPSLTALLPLAGRVVLKLPRTFDLGSLHVLHRSWTVELGLGPASDSIADRPRVLTAYSVPHE